MVKDYGKSNCEVCDVEFIKKSQKSRTCSKLCYSIFQKNKRDADSFFIYDRDGFKCFYCGISIHECSLPFAIDHVIPRSENGNDTAYNVVLSCKLCNSAKAGFRLSAESEKSVLEEVKKRTDKKIKERKESVVQAYLFNGTYSHLYKSDVPPICDFIASIKGKEIPGGYTIEYYHRYKDKDAVFVKKDRYLFALPLKFVLDLIGIEYNPTPIF